MFLDIFKEVSMLQFQDLDLKLERLGNYHTDYMDPVNAYFFN